MNSISTPETLKEFLERKIDLVCTYVFVSAIFERRRKYNIPVPFCRSIEVQRFIASSLAPVQKLLEKNNLSSLTFVILGGKGEVLERFVCEISKFPYQASYEELESVMRGFLVKKHVSDALLGAPDQSVERSCEVVCCTRDEIPTELSSSPLWLEREKAMLSEGSTVVPIRSVNESGFQMQLFVETPMSFFTTLSPYKHLRFLFALGFLANLLLKNHIIVLSMGVIEELDGFKSKVGELATNARSVIRYLDELRAQGALRNGVPMQNGSVCLIIADESAVELKKHEDEPEPSGGGKHALRLAYRLNKQGEKVKLITKDVSTRIKADALGISVEDYEKGKVSVDSLYSGFRYVEVEDTQFEEIKQHLLPPLIDDEEVSAHQTPPIPLSSPSSPTDTSPVMGSKRTAFFSSLLPLAELAPNECVFFVRKSQATAVAHSSPTLVSSPHIIPAIWKGSSAQKQAFKHAASSWQREQDEAQKRGRTVVVSQGSEEDSSEGLKSSSHHTEETVQEIETPRASAPFSLSFPASTDVLAHPKPNLSEFFRLRELSSLSHRTWNLTARSREQLLALELLQDPAVKVVTLIGQAGTGKTLLALASALEQVFRLNRFERIIVTRPVIPMGKDIGYLPGGKDEKLLPWMQPIFDNLAFLCPKKAVTSNKYSLLENLDDSDDDRGQSPVRRKQKKPQKRGKPGKAAGSSSFDSDDELVQNMTMEMALTKVQMEALSYIRGRSIMNQFIIVDEAQNLTPHEVKTVISRCGEGTKMILTGDPYQIDNIYLDSNSNGLSYSTERLKMSWLHGHATLRTSERSELAALAADVL